MAGTHVVQQERKVEGDRCSKLFACSSSTVVALEKPEGLGAIARPGRKVLPQRDTHPQLAGKSGSFWNWMIESKIETNMLCEKEELATVMKRLKLRAETKFFQE